MLSRHLLCGIFLLLGYGLLGAPGAAAQTTWYVDDDAPNDPGPGTPSVSDPNENGSEAHPFDAIQEAIDAAAAGDLILVADGTYTGYGNRAVDYRGKAVRIRSVGGDPEICRIDCQDMARGFFFHSGETAEALLEGMTITGGYTDPNSLPPYPGLGGGILCINDSSPTIKNCTLQNNEAEWGQGGGICCIGGSPVLDDCQLSNNRANDGGGLYVETGTPTVRRCTINNNAGSHGAGVCAENSDVVLDDCTIAQNKSGGWGSGLYLHLAAPTLVNCVIEANQGYYGAGLYCKDSNAVLTNCTVRGNISESYGAGFYVTEGVPILTNCTINDNRARYRGGGLYCISDGNPTLTNCAIRDNFPLDVCPAGGNPALRYCVLVGGWAGEGNIDADPLLTPDGHLRVDSPGRDAGDPNGSYVGQLDMDGEPRVAGERVDIGADEFTDADEDGLPDWWELEHFSSTTAGDALADEDDDGKTNLMEYADGTNPRLAPVTRYVAVDGDDAWDGLAPQWNGAHGPKATVQAAIDPADAMEGDEVILADGTYTGAGNRNLNFHGKRMTVRSASGDPRTCIFDCKLAGAGFEFSSHEKSASVVRGLTVMNGKSSGGGAVYCLQSDPTFIHCVFTRNVSSNIGGAVRCLASKPTLINCIILDNQSTEEGGGLWCGCGAAPALVHCTIRDNWSYAQIGGLYCDTYSKPQLTNCILWNNAPLNNSDFAGQVLKYCILPGGWSGTGNIDADPLITPDGHLRADSPARDAGNPDGPPACDQDMDGEPRLAGTRVDIGADEFLDTDDDGLPDWWESLYFSDPLAGDPDGDEDQDGRVNLDEYAAGSNPLLAPRTLHVDPAGNDEWDGLAAQWNGAHGPKATIGAALETADAYEGDEIVLANGVYAGPGNRNLDFGGKQLIVRSATDDPQQCVIDCESQGRGFYFHSGEPPTCVLRGLSIINGLASSSTTGTTFGGAVLCGHNSRPTLIHCVFSANVAGRGGALACTSSAAATIDCICHDNRAVGGGGVYLNQSHCVLTNCTLHDNLATGSLGGGAIEALNSNPSLLNCKIDHNSCNHSNGTGGGLHVEYGDVLLIDCTISNNLSGGSGGGIYVAYGDPTLRNCTIAGNNMHSSGAGGGLYADDNLVMENCVITNNGTYRRGGGVTLGGINRVATFTGCTFTGNTGNPGAVCCFWSTQVVMTNCILWNNGDAEIEVDIVPAVINYCLITGGWPTGIGNLSVDPLFADPDGPDNDPVTWEDNNYRLQGASPGIDAGDNAAVPDPSVGDFDGRLRFADRIATPDTGNPGGTSLPIVDLGAFEHQCTGDLNGDGRIDLSDLAHLLGHYGATDDVAYADGDLDQDGRVAINDLAALLSVYGMTCE